MRPLAGFGVRWWWAVLLAWGIGIPVLLLLAPPFSGVAVFDDSAYLPPDSEARRGQELLEEGWPEDNLGRAITVAFVRPEAPLQERDREPVEDLLAWLRSPAAPAALGDAHTHLEDPALTDVLTSENGRAWLVAVDMEETAHSPAGKDAVRALREQVHATAAPEGLERYVTGFPAVAVDEDTAIEASVERTTVLTLVLVTGLLLYIFRSPVAMFVPLVTVGAAYLASLAVVSLLAARGLEVSFLFQTFGIVIIFGAGTDYSLLLISRYAEELHAGEQRGWQVDARLRRTTLVATVGVLAGALVSAAASTITGFSAQSVAEFGLFRTMGPALAVAVALTLLAGLTLTPALMRALSPVLFWPERGKRPPSSDQARVPLLAQQGEKAGT